MDEFAKALFKSGITSVPTLLLQHYREIGMTNTEFLIYLQIKSFSDRGVSFPATEVLAKSVGVSDNELFQTLHTMIAKHLMQINTVQQKGQLAKDAYDFSQLYEKLSTYVSQQQQQRVDQQVDTDRDAIFQQIEEEFGRPLSPIELQSISKWLDEDHYSASLIQLALKETVLNQVYSLKYMDRILLSWEKKHITTPQQVQQERENRQNKQAPQPTRSNGNAPLPKIPTFKIDDNRS